MGTINNGRIAGVSDGAVPLNMKSGTGFNSTAREVMQSRNDPAYAPTPMASTPMPSLIPDGTPMLFNTSAASGWTDPYYTEQMFHSDMQFWGWENKPSAGSGYMH